MARILVISLFLAGLLLVPRWVQTHPDRETLEALRSDVEVLEAENVRMAADNYRLRRQVEAVDENAAYQREIAGERHGYHPPNTVRVRFE